MTTTVTEKTTSEAAGATLYLAELLTGITYDGLSDAVVHKAKLCLLDQVGCLLIGSTLPWTRQIAMYVESRGGVPESRVVNRDVRLPAHAAAMVNAVFGQGCEWDDYTVRGWGGGHSGSVAVPVGLAVGEPMHSSGTEFITAMVAGYESMSRVGKSVRPGSDWRNFHVHGILSPFGSAAAAGKLLGLDAHKMTMAIGIAASHCSGTMEYDQTGGEVKRLHSGIGARAGVDAAYLSLGGLTAPPTILEGRRGFCNSFSADPHPLELMKPLDDYLILETGFKLYPCVATILSSIQAAQGLLDEAPIPEDEIESIDVRINPGSVLHGGTIYRPEDVSSAQFSLPFSLAIRFALGSNDLTRYMDESLWHSDRIQKLSDKVHSIADEKAAGDLRHSCDMTVTLKGGKQRHIFIPYAQGSFLAPIDEEQLVGKFRSVAGRVVDDKVLEQIIEMVFNLEQLDDIGTLAGLLGPAR